MKQISLKMLLFNLFILSSQIIFSQTATIQGKIVSSNSKELLTGAFISLKNTGFKTISNNDGSFIMNNITPGKYELTVEYVGYASDTRKIMLETGQSLQLTIALTVAAKNLSEVNVYGRLDKERENASRTSERNANNIINVISARAIERSPDINAANVLQRMSGVTLQKSSGADESYAIIRGMEPRYNNTLINSVKITSPDEKSRFVSLNIVPSDLLQRIEVSKSLLPEMEGDAIGGTVNLIMKDAPDTSVVKAVGSIGYSNIFFDRKYGSFSKSDIQQKSVSEKSGPAYVAQPSDFSRSNLDFTKRTALPSGVLGLTLGKRFFNRKLGILISDNFQNQYYGSNSQFNIVAPDITNHFKPGITDVANRTSSTQQLNNGLTLHADYQINERNKIIINNVFLYSYTAQARLSIDTSITGGNGGRIGPGTGSVFNNNRSFINHQYLENLKVEGQHILSKHFLFDWAGVMSTATKKSPDRADIAIDHKVNADFTSTPFYFDNITRIWQHNEDKDYNILGSLNYKSTIGNTAIELKAGGLYRHKTRYNQQDQYTLRPVANTNGVKQVFTDIYSAKWIVYNPSGTFSYDANNYHAYENITASYGEAKMSLKNLDVFGGVRIEDTRQGYDISTFIETALSSVTKTYRDVLPSIQFKYTLNKKTNLRVSYYKSISRPNYYELVPYTIRGQDYDEVGNPNLMHTIADNFDLRYELYPGDEEQILVSGFYKNLKNPIENALVALTGGQLVFTPQNFADAKIIGTELVYTKYIGNFGVTGNYTYIYSNVKASKIVPDSVSSSGKTVFQQQSRPLQGQSNNVINLSLLYRNDKKKAFVQLAYEYIGKTLSEVYPNYGYDYYQQPQSYLALSAEKGLNNHFTAFGKFNNLLNTPTTIKINNITVGRDIYKANFLVGVRYSR